MDFDRTLEEGLAYLNEGYYDLAINSFISLYENGEKKEEVLSLILDTFLTPNIEELTDTYNAHFGNYTNLSYGELSLLTIPVSDTKFYLFDKVSESFQGYVDFDDYVFEDAGMEINPIMIADMWDMREILKIMKGRGVTTYIVTDGVESYLASFIQMPGFVEHFMTYMLMVASVDIVINYLNVNNNESLPKTVYSNNSGAIIEKLGEIHLKRISEFSSERSPLLSICIPSYNRGKEALRNIAYLLTMQYDCEVEILLSDNASVKGREEYDEIANYKDSRLRYIRREENGGFAQNVITCVENAKGKHILLCGDQDLIIIDKLPVVFRFIMEREYGGAWFNGHGRNARPEEGVFVAAAGSYNAYFSAVGSKFMTGVLLNSEALMQEGVMERIKNERDNRYHFLYLHALLLFETVSYKNYFLGIDRIWVEDGVLTEEEKEGSDNYHLLDYMMYEDRVDAHNGLIRYIDKTLTDNEIKEKLTISLIRETKRLINIAYRVYNEEYSKIKSLDEIYEILLADAIENIERASYIKDDDKANYIAEFKKEYVR